jgi:xanthine dehydrogenase accessory protein XdhC
MKHTAREWLARGEPAVVVEVAATQGSVPREAGTRMLVGPAGTCGTIGGGHLELQAIELARRHLAMRPGDAFERRYPLGPALGQCCGGVVTLRFAPLCDAELARWPDEAPLFHLQLYGAGHVGRAIVRLLATLPCKVQWIDEREAEFPASWPPQVERVCVDAVEAEVDTAPPGACYLVLTHRHDLDLRITEAILRRGDFRYFGLIGSQTKRARFTHRLLEQGIAPQAIERMTCPIGVPGIEGKAPEVIAVAVVAQLLQLGVVPDGPPRPGAVKPARIA